MNQLILERSPERSYLSTISGGTGRTADSGRIASAVQGAVRKSLGTAISSERLAGVTSPIEEKLFDSRANFKVTASRYAMHLATGWRDRLFAQIDALLDIDEWLPEDVPVTAESARTFLRMLVYLNSRRPGLGATHDGNLIASWTAGQNNLTVVCQAGDRIRWVVSVETEEGRETASGNTMLARLPAILAPYNPDQWFGHDGPKNPG